MLIFLYTYSMDFRILFSHKRARFTLYNFTAHYIYIISWHHTEKYMWNGFCHTFPIHFDFDFTFTFSLWMIGTFWVEGFNNKVSQLDWTFYLIYILGVVQGVSSTLPSAIQVKVVSKNWLRIRTQGPRLPPGRSSKVKNSNMKN